MQIGRDEPRLYQQVVRFVAEEQDWQVRFFDHEMVRSGAAIATVVAAFAIQAESDDWVLPAPRAVRG